VSICVRAFSVHLYLLLMKANDGESISHNFPTILITDRAHPWTVSLTERETEGESKNKHTTNMQTMAMALITVKKSALFQGHIRTFIINAP